MNVTFAVMAHPRRQAWAKALARQLEDAPIVWATRPWATRGDWSPIWRTRRAALALAGEAPFHCIVQDDALLAPGFLERVRALVEHGDYLYGLFYRHKRSYQSLIDVARRAEARGYFVSGAGPILGVGLVIPAGWTRDLMEFGDADPGRDGDDDRIRRWMRARGHDVLYPIPSLVDHREGRSTIGNADGRRAWRFAA